MPAIQLKEWNVWAETDFTEDGIQKILCKIAVIFSVINKNQEVTTFTKDIETVYLNSLTGFQMDAARLAAINSFISDFIE